MKRRQRKKIARKLYSWIIVKYPNELNLMGVNKFGICSKIEWRIVIPGYDSIEEILEEFTKMRKTDYIPYIEMTQEQFDEAWENGGTAKYDFFLSKWFFEQLKKGNYKKVYKND